MYEDIIVSVKDCRSVVEDKASNIKALVVALSSLFINTKLFPFPILNLC